MGWLGFGNNKSASAEKKKNGSAELRAEDEQLKDAKGVGTKSTSPSTVQQAAPSAPLPSPTETSVFEFGSAVNSEDRITLAGYCSVSNDLEPCQWEILPSGGEGIYQEESHSELWCLLKENEFCFENWIPPITMVGRVQFVKLCHAASVAHGNNISYFQGRNRFSFQHFYILQNEL